MRPPTRFALAAVLAIALVLVPVRAAGAGGGGMIYDVIENVEPLLTANFGTDMTALVAAKGAQVTSTAATVYKREMGPLFAGRGQPLPGIGLWPRTIQTQARRQTKRDNLHLLVYDYFARGPDAVKLQTQLELAAEAILLTVDRTYQAGGGVYGSGEIDKSVTVQFIPVVQPKGRGFYEGRVLVVAPVNEEDTGLPSP